jgi:hypothetical protein
MPVRVRTQSALLPNGAPSSVAEMWCPGWAAATEHSRAARGTLMAASFVGRIEYY